MWLIALVSAAVAAPAGYYHPQDLAARSERFSEVTERSGGAFEDASRRSSELARALRDYREALDLLGDRAPAAERERLEELQKTFNRQRATLQAFAETLLEDVDGEFRAAVERAVASVPGEVTVCEGEVADGPRVPGMRQRTRPNPDCTGDDLNDALAGKVDADPALRRALREIVAVEWPALDLPSEPQAPVGGGARWISVHALLRQGAAGTLKRIVQEDDEARLPFQAAIEQGASAAELAEHVDAARRLTAATASKRARAAAPVLEIADSRLQRLEKRGEPATGWCANPPLLGGCTGDDATGDLVARLLDDKKVGKALPR